MQCSRAVIATHFQTACCGCCTEFKTSLVSWQEIQFSLSKRVFFLQGSNDLKNYHKTFISTPSCIFSEVSYLLQTSLM